MFCFTFLQREDAIDIDEMKHSAKLHDERWIVCSEIINILHSEEKNLLNTYKRSDVVSYICTIHACMHVYIVKCFVRTTEPRRNNYDDHGDDDDDENLNAYNDELQQQQQQL